MPEATVGKWSFKKCPTRDIKIAPSDRGTLWLVQFRNEVDNCKGEIAITQGVNAETHARLFAAAPTLLTACRKAVDFLEDIDQSHGMIAQILDEAIRLATSEGAKDHA